MVNVKKTLGDIGKKVEETTDCIVSPVVGFAMPRFAPVGRVLVTGGTGVVGYRVAARLLAEGYPEVRIAVRDTRAIPELKEKGADLVEFCWEKEDTYSAALEGVKTVFCTTCGHEGWEEWFPSFLKVCKSSGVTHFVKLSFYHALNSEEDARLDPGPFKGVDFVEQQGYCDKEVMKSPHLDYTILFATHFMSNPLRYQSETIRTEDKFYGASGLRGVNYVSPNDVADVAVRAILAPRDHFRVCYTLTGPQSITDLEVAHLLGKAMKKGITYENRPASHFEKDFGELETVKASGAEESMEIVCRDIEKVCGRPAETYEEYLEKKDLMSPKELIAYAP